MKDHEANVMSAAAPEICEKGETLRFLRKNGFHHEKKRFNLELSKRKFNFMEFNCWILHTSTTSCSITEFGQLTDWSVCTETKGYLRVCFFI